MAKTIFFAVYSEFPEEISNQSWSEFNNEISYVLGADFNLTYVDQEYNENGLNEGENYIQYYNGNITLEKLQTVWSGLCYKITFTFFTFDRPNFSLVFNNETVSLEDIPLPEIYVTSENNAYGILGYGWNNGEELKFALDGSDQDFKLYTFKRTFLNVTYIGNRRISSSTTTSTKTCSKYLYNVCEAKKIKDVNNYENCTTCLAITLPTSVKEFNEIFPECITIDEYVCMKWKINDVFNKIHEECPKHCSATQFTGKRTFILHHDKNDDEGKYEFYWYYLFSSKEIEVNEEYLLYDITGVIGAVGGTLGLFIGFSFRDVIVHIIDGIRVLMSQRKKNRMSISCELPPPMVQNVRPLSKSTSIEK